MTELARVAALIGVLGTAVVFGTDVFCAMVQRPALALIDDRCAGRRDGQRASLW